MSYFVQLDLSVFVGSTLTERRSSAHFITALSLSAEQGEKRRPLPPHKACQLVYTSQQIRQITGTRSSTVQSPRERRGETAARGRAAAWMEVLLMQVVVLQSVEELREAAMQDQVQGEEGGGEGGGGRGDGTTGAYTPSSALLRNTLSLLSSLSN